MTDQQLPEESHSPASPQSPDHRRRWQKAVAGTVISLALLGVGGAVGMAVGDANSAPSPTTSAPTAPPTAAPTTTLPGKAGGKHAGKHANGKSKTQPAAPTTTTVPPAA